MVHGFWGGEAHWSKVIVRSRAWDKNLSTPWRTRSPHSPTTQNAHNK